MDVNYDFYNDDYLEWIVYDTYRKHYGIISEINDVYHIFVVKTFDRLCDIRYGTW